MVDLDTVLEPHPSAVHKRLAEEGIVLRLEGGDFYRFGTSGSFIWEQLDGRANLGEIAAKLAQEFDVGIDLARKDVLEFATSLESAGLVVLSTR